LTRGKLERRYIAYNIDLRLARNRCNVIGEVNADPVHVPRLVFIDTVVMRATVQMIIAQMIVADMPIADVHM
jgi:hypothetical protein